MLGSLLCVCVATPLAGQEEGAPPPQRPDTTELVFEREVFAYPAFQRRDPFDPLVDEQASGPRFEQLTLLGIIHSPDPSQSVALLGVGVEFNEEGGLQVQQGRGGVDVESPPDPAEAGGEGAQAQEQQEPQEGPRDILGTGYRTYRVRAGETLGNSRILEIQRMRVIVEVTEFGLTERRELRLRQPGDRGGQP